MGEHVTLIQWDVYEEYVAKADIAGKMVPKVMLPQAVLDLIPSSMAFMRGGRHPDGAKHHLIRKKLSRGLGQKQVLQLAPRFERIARRALDKCVEETKGPRGEVSMEKPLERWAFEGFVSPILGDLPDDQVDEMFTVFNQITDAFVSFAPFDLPFTVLGKAVAARRKAGSIIRKLLANTSAADGSTRNALQQMASSCKATGDRALTEDEIVDTVVTLVAARQIEIA